jgi:hypothetical protein
MEENS